MGLVHVHGYLEGYLRLGSGHLKVAPCYCRFHWLRSKICTPSAHQRILQAVSQQSSTGLFRFHGSDLAARVQLVYRGQHNVINAQRAAPWASGPESKDDLAVRSGLHCRLVLHNPPGKKASYYVFVVLASLAGRSWINLHL